MRNLLAAIYWLLMKRDDAPYEYELPKNGFQGKLPMRLASTVVPDTYKVVPDVGYFSLNMLNNNGNSKESPSTAYSGKSA